jgi:trans-L-3-hydroxyproline dehydratase
MNELFESWNWQTPANWVRISAIDMHTGGEPLRVFTAGLPVIEGRTVLEKRRYFREHYDHIRSGMMWEPRGHADMYGAIVTSSLDADLDVFFFTTKATAPCAGMRSWR